MILSGNRSQWKGKTVWGEDYDWSQVDWVLGTSFPQIPNSIKTNNRSLERYLVFWRQTAGLIVYIDSNNKEQIRELVSDPRIVGKRQIRALFPVNARKDFDDLNNSNKPPSTGTRLTLYRTIEVPKPSRPVPGKLPEIPVPNPDEIPMPDREPVPQAIPEIDFFVPMVIQPIMPAVPLLPSWGFGWEFAVP